MRRLKLLIKSKMNETYPFTSIILINKLLSNLLLNNKNKSLK